MTTQQPEALRLANILRGIDTRSRFSNEKLSAASAALENQHARITELEAQLAQRFDAADMATAAASGFRDGAASAALASTPAQSDPDERRLRRHLCATFEHLPYMDDGEAQGQSLDWLRCTVDQIDARIREVRLERIAPATAQPEVPAGCVAMPRAAISRAIEVLDWLPTSDSMQTLWAKQQAALDELRLSLAAAPGPADGESNETQ